MKATRRLTAQKPYANMIANLVILFLHDDCSQPSRFKVKVLSNSEDAFEQEGYN